jgi:DNA polymerase (family 10)
VNNYEIADHFALLGKLMDIHGENSFKAKSYSIAAFNIEKLTKEIEEMDDAELFSQKGIGDSTGKKIREIQNTGKLAALEAILAATPPGVVEMLDVKGIGPKKIAIIWKEMGIETVGELEYACNENRLVNYKGFGAKTQEGVLKSIEFINQNKGYHLFADVFETSVELIKQLRGAFPKNLIVPTGSVLRQLEFVDAIEVLCDVSEQDIIRLFEEVGDTTIEKDERGLLTVRSVSRPAIKFHFAPTDEFYYHQFVTIGNSAFVEAFLSKYPVDKKVKSHEEIFKTHNIAFIPPALREDALIIDKAANNTLPELIQPKDVKGIIHSHSTWSDGLQPIEQMAKAAIDKGFEYLVISDHSQTAAYAGGLKPEQIAAQHQEIDALNAKLAPFKIFKSIESDILGDGSLDYSDSVLETFDLVIASVHSNLKMTLEKAMDRVMKAVTNPYTTILGHPTGRLLLSREGYPLDHKLVIDTCAAHNVVVEINAHPRRLDLDWRWIAYAIEKGVLLSIDPDAHSVAGYHDIYYGVMAAQKGGLTVKNNLSSFTLKEFEAFLEKYKAKKKAMQVA